MYTMTELDEILEKADYFDQLRQQKELLSISFQNACTFAYGGGIFQLSPEFISGTSVLVQDSSDLYVLDRNQQAVLIKNPTEFISKATEVYRAAISEYGLALAELKKKRSAKAIIES